MSHTGVVRLARSWSARTAFLALSVGLGMAALFLFSGIGPLGPAPAAHAALSPPDTRPTAPAAKSDYGPFPDDDNMHCHHGDAFDPVRQSAHGHTHNDFHSGFRRDTAHPSSEHDTYANKYASYFRDFEEVRWSADTSDGVSTFDQDWKPPGQPDWHNHGDNDTFWWTPDADNGNTCLFTPSFPQASYTFTIYENTAAGVDVGDYPVQAHDEDGDKPVHTLEGADRASFSIDRVNGQLKTKALLDYEAKNSYSVTVRARDPGGRSDTAAVTINVTNVEEPGVVALSPRQPRVGGTLTARLMDPDGSVTGVTWQWHKSPAGQDPWTHITAGITTSGSSTTYTPVAADEGTYLRATASYTDGHGSGKRASKVSVNAVQAAPYFGLTTDTRRVSEDTGPGKNIGAPVRADNHQSGFRYSLGGADARSFSIVRTGSTSGQLQTRAALNYETKNSYSVTVTATDAARESDTITVTITVTDVEEPGVVALSPRQPRVGRTLAASLTDPDGGVTGVTWQWARSDSQSGAYENIDGATSDSYTPVAADDENKYLQAKASYTDQRGPGKTAKAETANAVQAAPYFGSTPVTRSVAEDATAGTNIGRPVEVANTQGSFTYTLGGTDRASFAIDSTSGQLRTKAALNYESKSSYKVTVTARDAASKSATIPVTIAVTDVDEDGAVTLSSQQPRVGAALTASLTDPDGSVSNETWQWARSDTQGGPYADISGATSASYTPVSADVDKYLWATASYNDGYNTDPNAKTSAQGVTANAVQGAPVFASQTATRSIAENTSPGHSIGNPVSATDSDTLTYSLGGADARSFGIARSTGQLQTKAPLNYETRHSYTVTVAATDTSRLSASITVNITVTNVDEDGAVALSTQQPLAGTGLTATLSDPDKSISGVSWRWSRANSKGGTYTGISGATSASYTPAAGDVGKYLRVTATYTDGHGPNKTAGTELANAVRETNRAPSFPSRTNSLSVAENTGAGTNIGNRVTATDPNSDTLTYSLAGSDAGAFRIDTATGQLRTRLPLDYERKNRYAVTVRATDTARATATTTVTVNVTDVEENGSVRLSSQQPRVGTRLTATLTDPDGQVSRVSWQWQSSDTRTGTFASISGAATSSYTPVGGDQGKYLKAVASYTDRRGPGKSANAVAASAVRAATINNPPVFGSNAAATESIPENTPANQNFGDPVRATDQDAGDTLTYTLVGTDSAYFAIRSTTGQLRTGAVLDYEDPRDAGANNVYDVTVRVSDGVNTVTKGVTITVTDVDEPGAVTLSSSHPRVGRELTATLREPDGTTASATWSWHSSANRTSWSVISGETSASYTPVAADVGKYLRATASYSDRHGSKTEQAVSVNAVRTANSPPVFSSSQVTRSIPENTRAGQSIGDPVRATDRDAGDTLTYTLGGTDAASFDIVATSGQLRTRATLDYERKRSYSVRVTATDTALASNTIPVTINVTDVNEPPTFNEGNTAARSVAENTAANANIGSLIAATDPDGDSLTYTLGGADAASFTIAASTGQLKTKALLNRATKASHTATVSVRDSRDSNGSPDTATDDTITVTITVTGVNDPPVFPDQDPDAQGDQDAKTLAVAENTPPGRNIGGPSPATDADSDALTYSLGGTDARSFGIVAATGQLLTKSPLDYETRNRYRVTVTAADTSSASDTVTVNINVTNVDEHGTVTLSPSQPRVGIQLTAALSDPDAPVTAQSWQWQRSNSRNGGYSDIRGATSHIYRPVAQDAGKYLRATVAYSDRHGPGKSAKSEPVTPVTRPRANTAPVFAANTATRSIAENTPANRNIGAPVRAADQDTGDRLTYTLSGTDAASFGIVASSGQLRTKAALDYERKHSYSVTVTVTDTAGASDTIAVTISVTNIEIPGKPGTPAVTAASASGHSALWVRWTAPGASAVIDGYNVQYRPGTSGNWYSARSASGTSATVSGLVPDTAYQVRVRAYNSEGRSGWSNPGQGRTDAAPIQQQRVLSQPTRTPTVCTPGIGFRTGVPWSFTAAKGGEDPPDVLLEVWNRDLCAMDFRVSSSAKWLSISPASGRSEGAHQEKQITLSADISGLDVGTHTAAVRITAPKGGNSPQTVSVSLTITRRAPPESNYCQERTVIESPDSAFRVVVPANSAPCDTGITVESLEADSQQTPVGEGVNVVRAGQVSAASADTRINAALWALLPGDRVSGCEEAAAAAVYRVVDGDSWDLLTHRCEMDEQGRVWLVLPLTSFGVYAVTLPAPSVESVAVGEVQLQTPEAAEADISPATPSPETMASNGPESSTNAVESQPTPAPKPDVVQVEVQPTPAPGPDVVYADASAAGLWADLPPEELTLPVGETGQSSPRRLGSLGILLYILAPIVLIIALLLIMFGVRNLRGAESASP